MEGMKISHGFYGGRTQNYRFYAEPNLDLGETIEHLDIVAMYPYILCNTPMPSGQPSVITSNFASIRNYRGFIYAQLLPPTSLRYPILPLKMDNNLIFTLCHACAREKKNNVTCGHSEQERAITGVYYHEELFLALDNGYTLLDVYEVWHWDEDKWSTTLRDFLNILIREKAHASGWPAGVTTEEEKDRYIDELYRHEGILLDKAQVAFNPPKRLIAKLVIDSFWDKYFVSTDSELPATHPHNNTLDVEAMAKYTNVVVAAITTAMGRLTLWNALNRLKDRALYCDMNSIIMLNRPGEDNLEELRGSYLGKWTSAVPAGFRIARFASTGPKVYSYQLEHLETGALKEIVKVRGFTLDQKTTTNTIDFNALRSMANSLTRENAFEIIKTSRSQIIKKSFGDVSTVNKQKVLRAVMDKLEYADDFTTLPYGWAGHCDEDNNNTNNNL